MIRMIFRASALIYFGIAAWATPAHADRPSISDAGVGCSDKHCIWITGSSLGGTCNVSVYAGDWDPPTAIAAFTGPGVYCSDNLITFRLPDAIPETYPAVNVEVSKPGGTWSSPFLVKFPSWNDSKLHSADYFGYNYRGASSFGSASDPALELAYGQAYQHPQGFLRMMADWGDWGTRYAEIAEFVKSGNFIYNTGWYPGDDDGIHPTPYNGDPDGHFASIQITQATITTPRGTFDLLGAIDPTLGEPYLLSTIPPYSYTLDVHGTLSYADTGETIFTFHHAQTWSPPKDVDNPDFNGNQTQSCISQNESWEDSNGGNVLGGGEGDYAYHLPGFWKIRQPGGWTAYMLNSWSY